MSKESGSLNLMASGMLNGLGNIAEIRRTYTAIETSFSEPGAKTIVVSSADMSEGKTVTVAGLATVAARDSERRVLLPLISTGTDRCCTRFSAWINPLTSRNWVMPRQ